MTLTDEQKAAVAEWVRDGAGLSDVQKRLQSEFDISMTYMDVRFLVIDLELTLQEEAEPVPEPTPEPAPEAEGAESGALPGGVSVDVDRLVKPGAVVSGSVVFSDGQQASWSLDQMGRLALDAGDKEYRPSEEDLAEFQTALRDALKKQGF
ncbi:MAG: hypothetical protein HN919_13570 [Verrucomicrobia bacterium]|jgi:hypothetical protein|nr:hypothetical protein [Verrucomicrobiota bacterium]MBT7067329.1 hypothetical protein [Verrucomicrobiota bacterium]MBT7699514.1 hypothetical protein [Verrucomicrobiota bacterium]